MKRKNTGSHKGGKNESYFFVLTLDNTRKGFDPIYCIGSHLLPSHYVDLKTLSLVAKLTYLIVKKQGFFNLSVYSQQPGD